MLITNFLVKIVLFHELVLQFYLFLESYSVTKACWLFHRVGTPLLCYLYLSSPPFGCCPVVLTYVVYTIRCYLYFFSSPFWSCLVIVTFLVYQYYVTYTYLAHLFDAVQSPKWCDTMYAYGLIPFILKTSYSLLGAIHLWLHTWSDTIVCTGVPEVLHITFSSINQKVYIAGKKQGIKIIYILWQCR